ncbi:MAG: 3-oxoacyl-(Acyl-carrier-protein) synthase II [Candidatus Xenolissoclinum pacificiensis L6]|uniref:3-oxoacyl-(Acyl-carrier-protein) synthase II n=1 Tax=Candidatus Xenolissoclinum pacificiensis L6 TaxID=1401685 RepID=W2V251_9RICK|nr:MAG: 3-oxoacyl-(Acyl-carrier-protein) synthase II [Candidatus Xenolissoclinum pacificiensis L6]
MRKRIVVTGLGMVSPLGSNVEVSWRRLVSGDSGIVRMEECIGLESLAVILGVRPMITPNYDTFNRFEIRLYGDLFHSFTETMTNLADEQVSSFCKEHALSDKFALWIAKYVKQLQRIFSGMNMFEYLKRCVTGDWANSGHNIAKFRLSHFRINEYLKWFNTNDPRIYENDSHDNIAYGIASIAIEWLRRKWCSNMNYGDVHTCAATDLIGIDDQFSPYFTKWKNKVDRFVVYAMQASTEALENSKLLYYDDLVRERVGVVIGSGIGGVRVVEENVYNLLTGKKSSPFFIPACLINLASGHVAIEHKLFGPIDANVTACASGGHSIINALRCIELDEADVVVAGGAESSLCTPAISGFAVMRALSRNQDPSKASRPWDKDRDGFVIGEGAGIVVLETLEHAQKRGAKILAEVINYGTSSDAYHISAPSPDASGATRAIMKAVRGNVDKVQYINAHGTSTSIGDIMEIKALRNVFPALENIPISSNKSAIGHMLGASASTEFIFTIKSLHDSYAPPTLNLDNPADECAGLNMVPHVAQKVDIYYALTNSFGFGGANMSILLKRWN